MLLELYLFLLALGFGLAGLSFFTRLAQKEMILIPFLAAAVLAFTAMGSFSVEQSYCAANETQDWSCHTGTTTDISMGYFMGGMATVMFIFAIYTSVTAVGEFATTGETPK